MLKNLTNEILDKILVEIKKDTNINKINNNITNPLVNYTFRRIQPYIISLFILLLLIFIIIIIILLLIIKNNFKSSSV